jgi:type I site-specific restriction endonuclease
MTRSIIFVFYSPSLGRRILVRAADWKINDRTQVRLEVPVDGYNAEPWNGVTDCCLYDASGNVLAVVEAKRSSRNARDADEQLRYYVTEIAKKRPSRIGHYFGCCF